MRVSLVANIPNDLVLWSVEHIVQRHCQVSDPQAGAEMPSCAADIVDDIFPQLLAQLLQLPFVEVLYVHWIVDCVQQRRDWFVASCRIELIKLVHRYFVKGVIVIASAVVADSTIDWCFDCLDWGASMRSAPDCSC